MTHKESETIELKKSTAELNVKKIAKSDKNGQGEDDGKIE